MAITTIYDVKLRYGVEGKNQLGATQRQAGLLSRSLGMLTAATAGFFGIGKAKDALIDFNAAMEQSRITMSGMIALNTNLGFEKSFGMAEKLVDRLQQRAKASVGTTKEFVDMAANITRPIMAAGMSMQNLEDITSGAVVAAKAFNIQSEMAALDIEQALMGTLAKKDRFARALLEPMGYDTKKFNALEAKDRAKVLAEAMKQPAILAMAKKQENSFDGITSTFKDNIQIALGKVGLPLFKAVTSEIKSWNTWLSRNSRQVADVGRSLGRGLVTGFKAAKEAIGFLIRHKEMLMTVAKAIIAFKAMKAIGGGILSIATAMTDLKKNGASAATALALVAAGAVAFADWIDTKQEAAIQGSVDRKSLINTGFQAQRGNVGSAQLLMKDLAAAGLINKNGQVDTHKMEERFTADTRDPFERMEAMNQMVILLTQINSAQQLIAKNQGKIGAAKLEAANANLAGSITAAVKAIADPWNNSLDAKKPDTNVTIRKIEVQSDDPDRFVFQLAETIQNAVKKPGSAKRTIRQ